LELAVSEQSQVQQTSETATKGGKREIFTNDHGLEVIRLHRQFIDPKKFVKRGALESDFNRLITSDCIVVDDVTNEILFIYKKLPFDTSDIKAALDRVQYDVSTRVGGLKTTSRVFGYLPRSALRRDFCTTTSFARSQPREHALVCQYGQKISAMYSQFTPETYRKHKEIMGAKILDEWAIKDTPFTSGIINKNNPLKYHFDAGNFKGVYSLMLGFKKDIDGGYLSIPDYNVGVEIADNSIFMFDGQEILHGVTPIRRLSAKSRRFTIVYYSMQQIWNCLPLDEELARIRKLKMEREEKRYQRLLEQKNER
jgi:hypothetical protein